MRPFVFRLQCLCALVTIMLCDTSWWHILQEFFRARKKPLRCNFIVSGNGILGKLTKNFGCKSAVIIICWYTSCSVRAKLVYAQTSPTLAWPQALRLVLTAVRAGNWSESKRDAGGWGTGELYLAPVFPCALFPPPPKKKKKKKNEAETLCACEPDLLYSAGPSVRFLVGLGVHDVRALTAVDCKHPVSWKPIKHQDIKNECERKKWRASKRNCACVRLTDLLSLPVGWRNTNWKKIKTGHVAWICKNLRSVSSRLGRTERFSAVRSPRFWVSGYCSKWRIRDSLLVLTFVERQNVAKALTKRMQHVGATSCNIVARNILRAFGHHVAQCCVRLANPAQHVATWSNNVACNMLHPFGLGLRHSIRNLYT